MKKKICVDIRMAFHSGIGTYIRNLLPYIQKSELSLQVLAPLSYIERWPALKTYDLIPLKSSIYSIGEQIELPLKIPSCDLFWSTHYNVPLAPIRAKKRLTSMHDVCHLAQGSSLNCLKRQYAKIMLMQAARLSDHVVTISHFSKNELMKWVALEEKKITVSHLAVDRFQFNPTQDKNRLQKIKELYGLPDNFVLYIGNLALHKNVIRLLKAWGKVQYKHSDYKLVLVGKRLIKQDFKYNDSVLYLGSIEQSHLPDMYQLAKLFVFPSLYEGFGLPPLESMMMGCPTIVSKAASLPEVCQEASIYIDPYSEDDIAQKISDLIENPDLRKSLAEKGLDHVNKFSWEKTALNHLEIIHRMIS